MEALASIATRVAKGQVVFLHKMGGPAWLRDVWQVEMKDNSIRIALVLDRTFRKRLEVDDFRARDQLARFDFQRVLKKHKAWFVTELFWTNFRIVPKSANLRDLIFFHDYPGEHMPTPKWRVVNVNSRKVLRHLLAELDKGGNVEQWLKDPYAIPKPVKETPERAGYKPDNRASVVYQRYMEWCRANGHQPVGNRVFSRQLKTLNIKKRRLSGGFVYER